MAFFSKFSIRDRLIAAFGCLVVITVILTVISIYRISRLSYMHTVFMDTVIVQQENVTNTSYALVMIRFFNMSIGHLIGLDEEAHTTERLRNYLQDSVELVFVAERDFLQYLYYYRESIENDPLISPEKAEEMLDIVDEIIVLFMDNYLSKTQSVVMALETSDRETFIKALYDWTPAGSQIEHLILRLRDMTFDNSLNINDYLMTTAANITRMVLLMLVGFSLLSVFTAIWMIKAIQVPITQLKSAIDEVTNGNFTYPIRLNYADELGRLSHNIADMVDSISEMNKAVTVADYIDTMIVVTDINSRLVYINKSYADNFGIDMENYEGKTCFGLFNNKGPCLDCPFEGFKTVAPGESCDCGIAWNTHLGKWIEKRLFVVKWPDGRLAHIKYLSDATEKKNQIDWHENYELEMQKVIDVTKAASSAKSAFIANTSHEIRTPMNNILGFSELILADNIPENSRKYIEKIISNINWLLNIINNMVDISNIESGMMKMESAPFDIADMLSHCYQLILPSAEEKNVILHFYAEPFLNNKYLVGDPEKLIQICLNILSNAIKFTDFGTVKCNVSLVEMDEEKCSLKFEFRDTGIGLTDKQIETIFDPFVQMDTGIKRTQSGVGLGLAITSRLITAMGGKLYVESEFGLGSNFYFTLQFPTVEMNKSAPIKFFRKVEISKPYFGKGEVLVVEDNEMNQVIMCKHLESVGLAFVVAQNGKEAVDIVSERIKSGKLFDLILMDIHMPIMDGLEAASIISGFNTAIPIVTVTANMLSVMEGSYMKAGMEDYLSKPYTAENLWKVLMKYFKPSNLTEMPPQKQQLKEQEAEKESDFFKKMQQQFVKGNKTIYKDIKTAVQEGDFELARRLAHNLKSNAGHIKQTALQEAAKNLEYELTDGQANEGLLQAVSKELESVLEELAPLLEETEIQYVPADPAKLKRIVSELEPLLAESNAAFLEYVDDLRIVSECGELVKHMENFDSAAALEALKKLKDVKGL